MSPLLLGIFFSKVQVQVGFMCVVMLVEIFWRNGGGEKKNSGQFALGEVSTRTPIHTDPTWTWTWTL